MNEQVLSIEQMKVLVDLGVDDSKASMCHTLFNNNGKIEKDLVIYSDYLVQIWVSDSTPTFTTHDLIMLLPDRITIKNNGDEEKDENYKLKITALALKHWAVEYECHSNKYFLIATYSTNLIDALFDMVVKCVKNGYIKTK